MQSIDGIDSVPLKSNLAGINGTAGDHGDSKPAATPSSKGNEMSSKVSGGSVLSRHPCRFHCTQLYIAFLVRKNKFYMASTVRVRNRLADSMSHRRDDDWKDHSAVFVIFMTVNSVNFCLSNGCYLSSTFFERKISLLHLQ